MRRVQLDWTVIRDFLFRRKTATSGETMGALLQRKQQVQTTLLTERAERPAPFIIPPRPAQKSAPPPIPTKPAEPASADDPQSTTERLLARKRKRQDDDKQ